MERRFSRLARFEEKRAYRRLSLSILGTLVILSSLVFLGLPALIKFSLWMSDLKSGKETSTTQDTIPPLPPDLEAPYTATNSATIAISGYAEPGTTLEIFLSGELIKRILLGNDGQFTFPEVYLNDGENKMTAQAKDTAGNVSQPTNPLTIIYKRTPPALEINQPQDGENFSGQKNEATVSGLTEAGATITVNNRLAMVRDDGTFTYSFPLKFGENLLKIVAIDLAGNQTTVERKVIFTP